jgi:hypothetical protein
MENYTRDTTDIDEEKQKTALCTIIKMKSKKIGKR